MLPLTTGQRDRTDDLHAIFEVSVPGAIRVAQALLSLLNASTAPMVIMISSSLGSLAWRQPL
jgi:NAD(P)-dependent dehydrogenase (short-subunit alcohol dehydrogenase family)